MQRRYFTVHGYATEVVLPSRSVAQPKLTPAVGVSGQRTARMLPPITLPHSGERWVPVDSYMPGDSINANLAEELDMKHFDEFIGGFEKAMVLFYDPSSADSDNAAKQFGYSAEKQHHFAHAFGFVDCTVNRNLCQRENATRLPMFKLYSNGHNLSTIVNGKNFTATQMHTMMKTTPVLTQPRVDVGMGKITRA